MEQHPGAEQLFGTRADLAVRYADILATRGVEWGLIGPREVGRIWDRHVVNSLAVAAAIPGGGASAGSASVVDVGSGAGLPGIPLALARPELRVTLLEPLLRRANFLSEVVGELGLDDRVAVVRGRAEEHQDTYDVVTCRAVARLPKLLGWCAPLIGRRGRLVALKGASASEEIADAGRELKRFRLTAQVETVVVVEGAEPTHLVVCTR